MSQEQLVVLKFGGTSVKSAERWRTIGDIVRRCIANNERPLIVCSALSQVTNALERLLEQAPAGQHEETLAKLQSQHRTLCQALNIDANVVAPLLESLSRLALGAQLTKEVSPRLRAKVLSHGELLSTTLGAATLNQQLQGEGASVQWLDARTLLKAREISAATLEQKFLSAACDSEFSARSQSTLTQSTAQAFITQGFIAANDEGETVLLGRGGSDTSAAYLAQKLGAVRCEIWTDVPGIFSANPKATPSARLLKWLDYDEAQEIASTGAKVLHPRCIAPCRSAQIPMHISCTPHPDIVGTKIAGGLGDTTARVKAISEKAGVCVLSMDTLGMWQQVGFLSDIFACFKKHSVSIDVVSTSESNVTVTLDKAGIGIADHQLQALIEDLNAYCKTTVLERCTAISLVGKRIRAILHQLGPVLRVFEEQKVHLVSQAASDLNVTFVVDEKDAPRIVQRLHALLFDHAEDDPLLGPSATQLFGEDSTKTKTDLTPWWVKKRDALLALSKQTPLYVYDTETISQRAQTLSSLQSVSQVFYAIKANSNPDLLKVVIDAGLGLECVSIYEVEHVLGFFPNLPKERILFTPNFASKEEYARGLKHGINFTVDCVHPLQQWPELFKDRAIFLRIDPGQGRGHHKHVRTAGKRSKFGIAPESLDEARAAVTACGARVVGLHAHAGSGIRDASSWQETAAFLVAVAKDFPEVKTLDLGGGLGVVERKNQSPLSLSALDASLKTVKDAHPQYDLWLEPGRYVVAEAGVILGTVTQKKTKDDVHYVGTDVGMNTLIRPALYGAFHDIVNLTRYGQDAHQKADVVGPICETGDTLGNARWLPETFEGDRMLFAVTGAYGRTMASNYNLRDPGEEVLI